MDFTLNKKPKEKSVINNSGANEAEEKDKNKDVANKEGEIEKELEECRKKAGEYLNGWKRTQADFVNYKKRQEETLDDWIIFSKTSLVSELLPILDSFETALKNKPASPDEECKKWIEGISKISEQLLKILKGAGLEEIVSVGKKMDPQVHEAVDVVPGDKEEGIVVDELQKGYKISGKVIRTSKVRVSVKNNKKQPS